MRATVVLFLLAATASANITTSYFLPNVSYGTNRLRFVASVINASSDLVTLSVDLDNDPDYSEFGIKQGNWTMGSTMFEYSTSALMYGPSISDGGYAYSLRCDIPASSAVCTVTRGPDLVRPSCRLANRTNIGIPSEERKYTQLYSFSDTDSVGVETIVRTFPGFSSRPNPEWCGTETDIRNISVPSSALVETYPQARSDFNAYQFIITAGEEKLPKATTGGAASTGSLAPTGTGGGGTGSEGAAPMKTLAPALAGLGAAVAWFL
ncbi:hypothetical protein DPSP01_000354 [Paraphaeosphaeria sporulosa]|uniref:Uncharacterized protein n=1 Tax=Paraphaeosphaeria sporulosa TaxID=1460663 RepID=A0A177C9M7_9PLEO|nr:uncharacterized protein CC84DRAFT_1165690 [Paraphaeosphaeria sporulosa]OAG03457.1 hypothetical protein CC84DRAFT_1165690 [Paraphaeosphaeria sporulosa]